MTLTPFVPAAHFASLADLKAANIAAGGHFFENIRSDAARGKIEGFYGGRAVAFTAEGSGYDLGLPAHRTVSVWVADAVGSLRGVHLGSHETRGAILARLAAKVLAGAGEASIRMAARLSGYWTGLGGSDKAPYLVGSAGEQLDVYALDAMLTVAGFERVEASDVRLPYAACWVNAPERAVFNYGEGDISLHIYTPAQWEREFKVLAGYWGAPLSAGKGGVSLPEWARPADVASPAFKDRPLAGEVMDYLWNTRSLYRHMFMAVANLMRYYLEGSYDPEAAARGFDYVLVEAVKEYEREYGVRLVKSDRLLLARGLGYDLPEWISDYRHGVDVHGFIGLFSDVRAAWPARAPLGDTLTRAGLRFA